MRRSGKTNRPRTLAILFPSTGYGGAERYVQAIARGAIANGWRVHAAFPELPATRDLRRDLSAHGVVCHAHAPSRDVESPANMMTAVRLLFAELGTTLRLLGSIRADSVMVSLPHPLQFDGAVLAASIVARRRAVIVFHLVSESLTISGTHRLVYRAARLFGSNWTCVSRASRRTLASGLNWPADAIGAIPNGVSTNTAAEPDRVDRPVARESVLRECGIPPAAPILLTAARLTSQKGHEVIARSMPLVLKGAPGAQWIWAGDGPLRDELAQLVADLGVSDHVHLLGFQDDLHLLLSATDLFVMPSRLEGGPPLALLEAVAAELPIIASDIPTIRELICDRESGILVRPDDPRALAEATVWAIEHPKEMTAMAARARAVVKRDYSEERMIAQTLALLETR